jgi:hypothetical protein
MEKKKADKGYPSKAGKRFDGMFGGMLDGSCS